ncbi:MAG: hypothetical protein ACE5NG_04380 [bacterium]
MKTLASTLIIGLLNFVPVWLFGQDEPRFQLIALGGVFSPIDNEIQNIYGGGPTGQIALAASVGEYGRVKFGGNFFNRSGDPFYQSRDFDAGDPAELTLTGLSLSLEANPLTAGYPRLYFGAGVEYVFGKEEITGQESGDGGAIGARLSVTPEFRLSQRISFIAEAGYRFLELTFKSDRDRYRFNLSGASLLLGLGYNFGS